MSTTMVNENILKRLIKENILYCETIYRSDFVTMVDENFLKRQFGENILPKIIQPSHRIFTCALFLREYSQ